MAEHNRQGRREQVTLEQEMAEQTRNKRGEETSRQQSKTCGGNQAKMHTGKGGQQGGSAHGQHAMSQQMRGTRRWVDAIPK